MLKHFTAALAALFFLFPLSAVGESLDLSQLGAIEEAEHWEERLWYQREDGSDWRVQDDGSVIVTLSATGDVTIGGRHAQARPKHLRQAARAGTAGAGFPALQRQKHLRGRRPHARQLRGHADQHQERHEKHIFLRRAAGICAGADLRERGGRQSGKQPRDGSRQSGLSGYLRHAFRRRRRLQWPPRRVHVHDGNGREDRHAGLSDLQRQL